MSVQRRDSRPLNAKSVRVKAQHATTGTRPLSDRQSFSDTGTTGRVTVGKDRGRKRAGLGLRAKFMLVMAGITVAALLGLGLIMSSTTNKYLFNQKVHDGVELAKVTAQLATSIADQMAAADRLDKQMETTVAGAEKKRLAKVFEAYLANAQTWSSEGASDILAIAVECERVPELANVGIGDRDEGSTAKGDAVMQIFIPKFDWYTDPPKGVQIFAGTKRVASGLVPIYRFKVELDASRFGTVAQGPSNVRVDIDARSVDKARQNLTVALLISVFLAIGAVIGVAIWLAGNITRPVDILMRDMAMVARGNLEHLTKPHSSDEIGVLASEFNRMTQNLKVAQSAIVEQEKAEYELSIAREVQRQLLPTESPLITGFDCAAFYQGAKAVSGDYYDFIPLGNGLWGFIVADVSGKGIPGSMVMAVTRTIVRLVANRHQAKAAETLKETNRLIARQIKRGMFVTSFYAILDERTGVLTYASAGHNPMVIYRAATKQVELAAAKGIALGFNDGPIFDRTMEEHRTVLGHGDAVVLYTDGFPEAMNGDNVEFGDEKFYRLIARCGSLDSRTMIDRLVNAIAEHRGEAEQSDDLTLITLRRA